MGITQSQAQSVSCDYVHPRESHNGHHCLACGTVYSRVEHETGLTDSHSHFPAVLCGIWLSKPGYVSEGFPYMGDSNLVVNLRHPCDTVSTTRLPERAAPTFKPSKVVSALLKYTDFTKNERAALKRGFFSTVNVNGTSYQDSTRLEGCHIHGCLFVEHGNLVFQALDRSARLPHLFTLHCNGGTIRSTTEYDPPAYQVLNSDLVDRTSMSEDGSTLIPTTDFSNRLSASSPPVSICRRTKHKMLTFLRDVYYLTAKRRCSCRHCRLPSRRQSSSYPLESQVLVLTSSKPDRQSSPHDCASEHARLPPPPLRLSWPLFTLRRFGFYGNSLFKLEAGRRAPRGEGHYLFVVECLRGFRRYFEKYVHRRKGSSSLTPTKSHSHITTLGEVSADQLLSAQIDRTLRLRPGDLQAGGVPSHLCSSATLPPNRRYCDHPVTIVDSSGQVGVHTDVRDQEDARLNLLKKKANSLLISHTKQPNPTPRCWRWINQQCELCQELLPVETSVSQPVAFPNSCPQLTASSMTCGPISSPQLDDIATLPDPPPPPTAAHSGTESVCSKSQAVYDNVLLAYLRNKNSSSIGLPLSLTESKPNATREWLNSLAVHHPGRLYTSRRAMTTLVCPSHLTNMLPQCEQGNTESSCLCCDKSVLLCDKPLPNPSSNRRVNSVALTRKCSLAGGNAARHASLPTPMVSSSKGIPPMYSPRKSNSHCHDFRPIQSEVPQPSPPVRLTQSTIPNLSQSPYYNLNSAEAFVRFGRSRNLPRCGFSMENLAESLTGAKPQYPAVSSSPASWNCTLRCRPLPTISSIPLPAVVMDANQTETIPEEAFFSKDPGVLTAFEQHPTLSSTAVHSSGNRESWCAHQAYSSGQLLGTLHYATLDFDNCIPDVMQRSSPTVSLSISQSAPDSSVDPGFTEANPANSVYGTLVSGMVFGSHNRFRSVSVSEPSSTSCNAGSEQDSTELPTNYVAICQLQTLAMRAVLNATT